MYVTQVDRYTVEIERIDAMNYWVIVTDDDGEEVAAEEKELPQAWANLPEAEIGRLLAEEAPVPATAGE